MLSSSVDGAVDRIDAALDALSSLDLSALSADELIRLAGRCETLARRQAVLAADIALEVNRREAADLGGAPLKVLADWLRITPAQARRRATLAEPLAPRRTLDGQP
ncbi:MAG: HNH endonuclease, partial [Mycobacterium sp.]|nr:HNH endonuclease [Mycobacterium sp.]